MLNIKWLKKRIFADIRVTRYGWEAAAMRGCERNRTKTKSLPLVEGALIIQSTMSASKQAALDMKIEVG